MVHHLYFAACDVEGGIYHYTMAGKELYFMEKTACDRPMYLNETEGKIQVLLRAPFEENQNSGLVEYPVDLSGKLGEAGNVLDTKGIVACHLCQYEGKTFAANYVSGSVFSSDGLLREHELSDESNGIGGSKNPIRQDAPHLHFVQPSPDGKCLFAVDLGNDCIYSYDSNLTLLSVAYVPTGCGARHLAYAEDGKTVFCANELDSSVSVFLYENMKLTLCQTVSVLKQKKEGNTAAAIRVKGRYIYVSNRGADSISCLEWDGKELKLCSETPCGGESPRDFLIVGSKMFVTNEKSDNVTIFEVNGAVLEKEEQELQMPAPLCVIECRLEK